MYQKIVWCYVFILTLLDISLNTKLTAQGKSHGVSIQDTFVEGVTFQEWDGEESLEPSGNGAGGGGGGAQLRFSPRSLRLGACVLGAAHAATVTVHNTANTTLHLASVAGTTTDFYASFFDTKSVPPDGNTTFSVVYVGRREGYVGANLYLHTSLGVHRYAVSAVGVASPWGLWPLVGLRVPHNATLRAQLRLTNPTAAWVQVREVYSSASWVRLALPQGGAHAQADAWLLGPRATKDIVTVLISLPERHAAPAPLTAYVRVKANVTSVGHGSGALLLAVEARAAERGHYAHPLHIRLGPRGTGDRPDQFDISLGNSGDASTRADAGVWAARCSPQPSHLPDPFADSNELPANANGAKPEGAQLTLTRNIVEPYQELTPTAKFTLDYGKLGSSLSRALGGVSGERAAEGGWCGGWVRVGGAAVPYSLRLLPGTVKIEPSDIRMVTSSREYALREHEVRVTNEFGLPLLVTSIQVPDDIRKHLIISDEWEGVVGAGSSVVLARVRLRRWDTHLAFDSFLRVHTNVTTYVLPIAAYSGHLEVEWEWVNSTSTSLDLGVVGLSSTRHVAVLIRNPSPRPLCLTTLTSDLPGAGAQIALDPCAHLAPKPVPEEHPCRCVDAGGVLRGVLTVVAPAKRGVSRGVVGVGTPHARTDTAVTMQAEPGRVAVPPLTLDAAAPYAWATADLVVDSTMDMRMRVIELVPAIGTEPDPAVEYLPSEDGVEVREGRRSIGVIRYAAEKLCEPMCYTGLDVQQTEGMLWLERGSRWGEAALAEDMSVLSTRRSLFDGMRSRSRNVSLVLHTSRARHVRVRGAVRVRWPRLVDARRGVLGWAGLAGLGAQQALRVALRNPSPSHRLLLQPALGPPPTQMPDEIWEGSESPYCRSEQCAYSREAFKLVEWRVTRGAARLWRDSDATNDATGGYAATHVLPMLLLEPSAEIELKVLFTPKQPALLSAYLYLRNNLTIVEGVQLSGRGAIPSFEIAGRRPGADEPIFFEVTECGPVGAGGVVRLLVSARNTGRVAVRLRDWLVAGRGCAARGFAVAPCQPLALAPNHTAQLALTFAPDWTLGRAAADLVVHTDLGPATFRLAAAVPAPLLPKCATAAHGAQPPIEQPLRAAAMLVTLALVALVVAAAALDAERLLRKARQQRQPAPVRAPLDLRSVAQQTPAPLPSPAAPAARALPPRRRRAPRKTDPAAESRAFERWRAALARHDDDSSRSSEDADVDADTEDATPAQTMPTTRTPPTRPAPPPPPDETRGTPDDPPHTSSGDDDAPSSGDDSSTPPSPDEDEPHPIPPPLETAPLVTPRRSPASRPAPATPDPDEPTEAPPSEATSRPRHRSSASSETPRRVERRSTESTDAPRSRSSATKHHLRKDKPKRRERPPATPPRSSPPLPGAGESRPSQPSPGCAPANVRWGASWSSVVARSSGASSPPAPALAPIGSDVRRRADAEPAAPRASSGDHSLFFFNGDPATPPAPAPAAAPVSLPAHSEPDFSWRTTQSDRSAFSPQNNDYINHGTHASVTAVSEEAALGSVGGGAYGSIGRAWGGALEARAPGAAWPWPAAVGGAPRPPPARPQLRPPPGFGGEAPAVAPAPRPFDPFRSLAAIWTPSALDWRPDQPADE